MIHFVLVNLLLVRFIVNHDARRRTCLSPSRGGQAGEKSLYLGFGYPLLQGKQTLPVFPIRFPHILRDLSRILVPSILFTNVKLGDEILPYFL